MQEPGLPASVEWQEGEGEVFPGCSCHITHATILGSRLHLNNIGSNYNGPVGLSCHDKTHMPFRDPKVNSPQLLLVIVTISLFVGTQRKKI